MDNEKWTYKKAGVDVHSGYETVKKIKEHVQRTTIPGVLGGLGSFGGMFEIPQGYKEPVLVSGTDGVGTKLQLAFMMNKHDTIGIDCVAMCVNDIACQGAKPLFFLDYIGTGVIEPDVAADIVKGISDGCIQAGCALVGGETAEMPGFYKKGEYDLAGFSVGIVEKSEIINGSTIQEGNILIGVASSGLHSNGYSLVRKLCFDVKGLSPDDYVEELVCTIGEELLKPTKIYVKLLQRLQRQFSISGIAHMTGGGWIENMPRIFADDSLKAVVQKDSVPTPPIFKLLQQWGNVDESEMYNTFNMGIGLVLSVHAPDAVSVINICKNMNEQAFIIGTVERRADGEESIIIA